LVSEAVESPGPPELSQQLFFPLRRFDTTYIGLRFWLKKFDCNSILIVTMGHNMKNLKKRKVTAAPKVEEINFDSESRQEWLTGFHKRKLQRAKHAQENAAKQYKEDKRAMRAKVRPLAVPKEIY
jgi:hypothetical protein